jgi:cellulose synthase/poly-beta-1,6-N-acetylglucosamine synthase-like glycosyltransferase
LRIDPDYIPHISVLIPARNEEKNIYSKLENLFNVIYPHDKMEVIVIDDASTDGTVDNIQHFIENHRDLPIKVLQLYPRKGKSNALNVALKVASYEILVVTDADTVLSKNILSIVIPFLSDSTIGAISGRGGIINVDQSWLTNAEKKYLDIMSTWRLGESKIHSTIRFEGSFCAFRKNSFKSFDDKSGSDDSGTALKVVQNNYRAIFLPEALSFAYVDHELKSRNISKIRRATQMTGLWVKSLKLLLNGSLKLPKKIAIPEIFLSIFNPIIFITLSFTTILLIAHNPAILIPFFLAFSAIAFIPNIRNIFVQGVIDQFILFYSLILYVLNKKFITWN